jgi:hypothetical protein
MINFDGFLINPISALRFIPLSLRRTERTPNSTGLFAAGRKSKPLARRVVVRARTLNLGLLQSHRL